MLVSKPFTTLQCFHHGLLHSMIASQHDCFTVDSFTVDSFTGWLLRSAVASQRGRFAARSLRSAVASQRGRFAARSLHSAVASQYDSFLFFCYSKNKSRNDVTYTTNNIIYIIIHATITVPTFKGFLFSGISSFLELSFPSLTPSVNIL